MSSELTARRRIVRRGGVVGIVWLVAGWFPVAELELNSWFWLGPAALLLAGAAVVGPVLYWKSRRTGESDSEGIEGRVGADGWLPTFLPLLFMGVAVGLAIVTSGAEPGCDDTTDPAWTDTTWSMVVGLNILAGLAAVYSLIKRRWFAVLLTLGGAFVCFFSVLLSFCWN